MEAQGKVNNLLGTLVSSTVVVHGMMTFGTRWYVRETGSLKVVLKDTSYI